MQLLLVILCVALATLYAAWRIVAALKRKDAYCRGCPFREGCKDKYGK